MQDRVNELNRKFKDSSPEELLSWVSQNYEGKAAFSTSLGAEDQVITHMISRLESPVKIFTLDTGRLFQETYDILDITQKKYNRPIDVFFPDAGRVEEMVKSKGINLFYESIENRRLCCHIRKIEPLKRALSGVDVWISGVRREQSVTRTDTALVEWEAGFGLLKVNPLINWTEEMVYQYVNTWKIPLNELHAKGYPSIGCLPCTRAVQPGEDLRSGRWWWEMPEFKECGLHQKH